MLNSRDLASKEGRSHDGAGSSLLFSVDGAAAVVDGEKEGAEVEGGEESSASWSATAVVGVSSATAGGGCFSCSIAGTAGRS